MESSHIVSIYILAVALAERLHAELIDTTATALPVMLLELGSRKGGDGEIIPLTTAIANWLSRTSSKSARARFLG